MTAKQRILAGEMHCARVPRAYWRARLDMAYAMGLSAISTYVFWNKHEPVAGSFDFDGENDVAAYVREAAAAGLDVVLRPGPYVCAEWDFGGLPAWLLDGREIALRTAAPSFMQPVRRWLRRLGDELAPLRRSRGGPIVAVQLENEYGAFGADAEYLAALRAALDDAGFGGSPYFTIDQPQDLRRGCLDGVAIAATFAAGDPKRDLGALRELRPNARLLCGEYWAGWFDRWGEPHVRRDDGAQVRDLRWMLRAGACFNVYMFHGGTNFGFLNGANASDDAPYQPVVTSYDYQAALDEAGRPTPKFYAFRREIAAAAGGLPRPLPPIPPTAAVEPFELTECAPLTQALSEPIACERPLPMERFGASFGYVLYRTALPRRSGILDVGEVRDYATVMLDGRVAGRLDRRLGERRLRLDGDGGPTVLDVLVENCGRINYGSKFCSESKGLLGRVTLDGQEIANWQVFRVNTADVAALRFRKGCAGAPAFYRGRFVMDEPADTFLDMRSLGKGVLFVNGHNAGRYWHLGPQRSLYVPGVWLKHENEIVVFDVMAMKAMFIQGTREPIIES